MSNDLMMRMKDQALIVLADYESCSGERSGDWEGHAPLVAAEIAKRMLDNYAVLAKQRRDSDFITRAQAEIEALILEAAKAKHDAWAPCRNEGDRIRMAYAISRIIEDKAGARHKFSVWSGTVYGARGYGRSGVCALVAAPSQKKAVEYLKSAFGCNESLSGFRDHWGGGGTEGVRIATKLGVWAAREPFGSDYRLIWEPKS